MVSDWWQKTLAWPLLLQQLLRFALVGVMGTLVHYIVLVLLVELAGFSALWATSCGALSGAVVNYFLNYRFTFASQNPHRAALPKFLVLAGLGLGLNALLMALLLNLGLFYLLAQPLATLLVLFVNFFANKYWTFRITP